MFALFLPQINQPRKLLDSDSLKTTQVQQSVDSVLPQHTFDMGGHKTKRGNAPN